MKYLILSVLVNFVSCQQLQVPLFVLNEVVFLDSETPTPNYDIIAANFAQQFEEKNANSFFQLKYQIPIFCGLVVVFCVMLITYCKLYCRRANEKIDKNMDVFSLPLSNPGFQGSDENVNSVKSFRKSSQQLSTIVIESEKSTSNSLSSNPKKSSLPKYLKQSSRNNTENTFTPLHISNSLYI